MPIISSPLLVKPAALDIKGVTLAYPRERGESAPSAGTAARAAAIPSGSITLLDHADWSLDGGAQIALCGPSGCGKTSLLNLLAAIEKPTTGSIRWDATELCKLSARQQDTWRRDHLGLVFQQFHLFPTLSALENKWGARCLISIVFTTTADMFYPLWFLLKLAQHTLDNSSLRPGLDE